MYLNDRAIKVYLTRQFSRKLNAERIPKDNFDNSITEILNGLSHPLGHKLHKKRIGGLGKGKRGGYRTIAYYRIKEFLIFVYLYAKNEKENITRDELKGFILLSREYDNLTEDKIRRLIKENILIRYH
jgi:hypothetical protein